MLRFFRTLFSLLPLIVGAVLVIWFAAANRGPVTISFAPIFNELTQPAYLICLLFFFSGFLLGALYFQYRHFKELWREVGIKKRILALENELAATRSRPVPPAPGSRSMELELRQ